MNINEKPQGDNELVRMVQSGDISAYEEIVKKYQNTIAIQMRRFSRDRHDIEDLTQQVFINAFTSINMYKPKAPFINWLRTIATRVGYVYWREKAKKPKLVQIEEWDGASLNKKVFDLEPEEAEFELDYLLDALKPNERIVVCLMYLDGKRINDVSEVTGWSVGKIKMLAHRGRKKLKELITESRRENEDG